MDKILVLDFGGQYNMLIARRVREQGVYAEIKQYDRVTPAGIRAEGYRGVILTGGPNSVYDPASPRCGREILDMGIPVLGICYGAQLLSFLAGGRVSPADNAGEYGKTALTVSGESVLFREVPPESVCWMSHRDYISAPPEGFRVTARTAVCPCAALECPDRQIYGVQFHPEVTHTEYGREILAAFLFGVCRCSGDWSALDYAGREIEKYARELKGRKALLALSGGVDSSVCAAIMHRAIGPDLTCVFVDHGLMRKNEGDFVEETFRNMGANLIRVNAGEVFFARLRGVTDPEAKRKIIGEEFIRAFEAQAARIGRVHALVQGTIYPDVIESGKGASAVIKSHHNVGGLPDAVSFDRIIEPLRDLFKDEVRAVGEELGLPKELVWRQPFPGPGLAVRILGEVTPEKAALLQDADAIFREEVAAALPGREPSQYFAVLTDSRSVGVMGDSRTYGYIAALRAVATDDFMTAEWCRLPYEALEKASSRITNEVPGISRVVYDISSKPPATVEWE